jgi:hypothetical protein
MDTDFNAALARLDDEIRDAETRLADLRLKRAGADAFLEYMGSALGSKTSAVPEPAPTTPTVPASDGDHRVAQANPSDAVMEVFRARPLHVLGIDEVYSAVSDAGAGLERAQVRNAFTTPPARDGSTRPVSVACGSCAPKTPQPPVGRGLRLTKRRSATLP